MGVRILPLSTWAIGYVFFLEVMNAFYFIRHFLKKIYFIFTYKWFFFTSWHSYRLPFISNKKKKLPRQIILCEVFTKHLKQMNTEIIQLGNHYLDSVYQHCVLLYFRVNGNENVTVTIVHELDSRVSWHPWHNTDTHINRKIDWEYHQSGTLHFSVWALNSLFKNIVWKQGMHNSL